MNQPIEHLKMELERAAGRLLQTAADFEAVAEQIEVRTHEHISPTTLKRMFGYLKEDVTPRLSTLNALARFAGYASYEELAKSDDSFAVESNIILKNRLSSNDVKIGSHVRLTWKPDRECVIEYLGDGNWKVASALNTKLLAGDTFSCHLFIYNEPLFIDNLIHAGGKPSSYVAGRQSGIQWEVVS